MDCDIVRDKIEEYCCEALELESKEAVEEHIRSCNSCKREYLDTKLFISKCEQILNEDFSPEIKQSFDIGSFFLRFAWVAPIFLLALFLVWNPFARTEESSTLAVKDEGGVKTYIAEDEGSLVKENFFTISLSKNSVIKMIKENEFEFTKGSGVFHVNGKKYHDKGFVVHTKSGDISVKGTIFLVDADAVSVTTLEGLVIFNHLAGSTVSVGKDQIVCATPEKVQYTGSYTDYGYLSDTVVKLRNQLADLTNKNRNNISKDINTDLISTRKQLLKEMLLQIPLFKENESFTNEIADFDWNKFRETMIKCSEVSSRIYSESNNVSDIEVLHKISEEVLSKIDMSIVMKMTSIELQARKLNLNEYASSLFVGVGMAIPNSGLSDTAFNTLLGVTKDTLISLINSQQHESVIEGRIYFFDLIEGYENVLQGMGLDSQRSIMGSFMPKDTVLNGNQKKEEDKTADLTTKSLVKQLKLDGLQTERIKLIINSYLSSHPLSADRRTIILSEIELYKIIRDSGILNSSQLDKLKNLDSIFNFNNISIKMTTDGDH
ncbi:MAG: FecR domain-containing protein [Planctomycetes bacterium]|nr:FecR domain-containing protein [Planctomycetota bacterium]